MIKGERYINATGTFKLDRSREYKQAIETKPVGLWYSFGDEWKKWCESNMPHWIKPVWLRVILNEANVLRIATESEFLAFSKEYKKPMPGMESLVIMRGIDWPRVAAEYDRIEFPVYFYKFRHSFESFWYYGFDVASGCVWNLEKIDVDVASSH